MRYSQLLLAGIAIAVGLILLSGPSVQSQAQKMPVAAAAANQTQPPPLKCTPAASPDPFLPDPFKFRLAGDFPAGLLPIDDKVKDSIMKSGLPCQENVRPNIVGVEQERQEIEGLENLQRGFDFYSWRTFIALNSPADGITSVDYAKADMPARWEDIDSFKPLLDVMLPANLQPPKWPTDRAGMEAERERLVPEQCLELHQQFPDRMIVKMIEESFNEPFKTGPLIDQQGHYAIFDILMNREMFNYITTNHLNTKAGQMSAANSGLTVDFPAGTQDTLGAFMLKVSWKILVEDEIKAQNFHTVKALVLMPPPIDPKAKRKCVAKTLGLIGFHAVHKTVNRPQWIWTSFEHIKNVPDRDEVTARTFDGPYSFFSVSCKSDCPKENATPPRPWDPEPALELRFRKDDSFKSQIVRETPLGLATKNMNKIFQSMLQDSVWKNYILVNTQWPSAFACTLLRSLSFTTPAPKNDFVRQPDMTCSPAPTFMANSTLETYSQGDIPQASSSCIGCHGNAVSFQTRPSNPKPGTINLNQSDFTFMLEKAQ